MAECIGGYPNFHNECFLYKCIYFIFPLLVKRCMCQCSIKNYCTVVFPQSMSISGFYHQAKIWLKSRMLRYACRVLSPLRNTHDAPHGHYVKTWRHPQNRKYIAYRSAVVTYYEDVTTKLLTCRACMSGVSLASYEELATSYALATRCLGYMHVAADPVPLIRVMEMWSFVLRQHPTARMSLYLSICSVSCCWSGRQRKLRKPYNIIEIQAFQSRAESTNAMANRDGVTLVTRT